MSDQGGQAGKGQQEPSMEDILASIRRILSEDEEAAAPETPAPPPPPKPTPKPDPELEPVHIPRPVAKPDPEPEPEPEPEPIFEPAMMAEPEPVFESEPEPEPEPEPAMGEFEAGSEDVLELTESMMVSGHEFDETIISRPTARASTDVLSDLARAILDRRELAIGDRGITLEAMVRGMLRPLLKEWLDRNLPYLIERLVKKEIDRMVNRAEKLED
ncbi:MAG: DUF2497 domain-containing protein [Rhodospirillales bacterium]|jgi:cell pole-organizing protein PopZ|nr:DUF2497 domain-containing protein [Rhodospirillales bacterium]